MCPQVLKSGLADMGSMCDGADVAGACWSIVPPFIPYLPSFRSYHGCPHFMRTNIGSSDTPLATFNVAQLGLYSSMKPRHLV
jgi:hypothetical protein